MSRFYENANNPDNYVFDEDRREVFTGENFKYEEDCHFKKRKKNKETAILPDTTTNQVHLPFGMAPDRDIRHQTLSEAQGAIQFKPERRATPNRKAVKQAYAAFAKLDKKVDKAIEALSILRDQRATALKRLRVTSQGKPWVVTTKGVRTIRKAARFGVTETAAY